MYKGIEKHIYIDSLISPSYTSAIAQAIQLPGISGMENNMVLLDFDKKTGKNLDKVVDNLSLISAGNFDIGVLASSGQIVDLKKEIHVWIRAGDYDNGNLMILLSFIILGHHDWKKAAIKIFNICDPGKDEDAKHELENMVIAGRLPISANNIIIIPRQENISSKTIINKHSVSAGLTIIGFREELVKRKKESYFMGYDDIGSILFINSQDQKDIC
jgi:hypothetical protein